MRPHNHLIRPLRETDLDEILENEAQAYVFPWKRSHFEGCLTNNYHSIVLEQDHQIMGHGIIHIAVDEAHLMNLTIRRSHQRQGWGRLLLNTLLAMAQEQGATMMFLEVRPSNEAGRHIYRQFGFEEIGRRKYYYPSLSGREDAIVMKKYLQSLETVQT